jgi:hypothetical protein
MISRRRPFTIWRSPRGDYRWLSRDLPIARGYGDRRPALVVGMDIATTVLVQAARHEG